MPVPKFQLGRVVSTPGGIDTMTRYGINPGALLDRHVSGDWGEVPPEDARENELSIREGFRIVSSYGQGDRRLWVITEADRSATTILRPDEY